MSSVDLGVRIFLQDAFSGGFGSISSMLRGFTEGLLVANSTMSSSATKLAALGGAMDASFAKTEKYTADFELLQEQIAASQVALEALQGTAEATGLDTNLSIAADEVLTYEQALEKAQVTLESLQAQGAIFTPAQEESLLKAQTDILLYQQAIRDLELTLPALNLNPWMNAVPIKNVESEIDKLQAKIVQSTLKLQTMAQVGFDKQAASLQKATQAQQNLATQAQLTQAQIDAEAVKQQELNDAMLAQEQHAKNMGTLTGVAVGAGIVFLGLGTAILTSIKDASALQDSMAQVQISFQATGKQAKALQDEIINIANQSQFSSKEVADAFSSLAEHGFTAEQVIKNHVGLAAVNLASAIKSDTVPAAELLSGAMQTFGAQAKDASHYADILTSAFYNGVPHIEELQQAIEQAGAQAASSGWSMQDLAVGMDLLAKRGISGSQAGTALRFMLSSLNDPTNKVQEALASMGVITLHTNAAFEKYKNTLAGSSSAGATAAAAYDGTLKSLNQMFTAGQKVGGLHTDKSFYQWALSSGLLSDKLFDASGHFKNLSGVVGVLGTALKGIKSPEEFNSWLDSLGGARSGKAFQALLQNTNQTQAQIKQLNGIMDKSGTAAKDAATRSDTYSVASKRLATTMTDLWARLGAPIVDVLTPFMNKLADLAGKLQSIVANNPQLGKLFAVFSLSGVAASGATLLAMGIGALATALAAISVPALITIGVLLAISGAIAYAATHWSQVLPIIQKVGQVLGIAAVAAAAVAAGLGAIKLAQMAGSFAQMVVVGAQMTAMFLQMLPAMLADAVEMAADAVVSAALSISLFAAMIPALLASAGAWLLSAAAAALAAAPVILLVALFAGMVIGIVLLIQHLGGMNALMKIGAEIWKAIQPAINDAGKAIKESFNQAIKELTPVWNQVVQAFNNAKPALLALGEFFGVILVAAIGIVIGVIRGLINVFAAIIVAVVGVVAGLIQAVGGIIQVFSGLWTILHGIFTGNSTEMKRGWDDLCKGVQNIIVGLWSAVKAVFIGAFSAITGFVKGFVDGIVGFFHGLADVLVGHSIIPDMLKSIQTWFVNIFKSVLATVSGWINSVLAFFQGLADKAYVAVSNGLNKIKDKFLSDLSWVSGLVGGWVGTVVGSLVSFGGRVLGSIGNTMGQFKNYIVSGIQETIHQFLSLPGQLMNALGNLGQMLFSSGANMMHMLANGITSTVGAVVNAAKGVATSIANLLQHNSPTKEGPLSQGDKSMPNMMKMYASGLTSNIPMLTNAAHMAAASVATAFSSPAQAHLAAASTAAGSAAGKGTDYHYYISLDGKPVIELIMNDVTKSLKMNGMGRMYR